MAYTYTIEDNFRPVPQTAFVGGRGVTKGIACHWTVGNPGRAGALGTVDYFLANPGLNASYHELWWWENNTFGVMRIVPPQNAAHSMNPAAFNPNDNTRRIMGTYVWDANRYAYAVSFAGMEHHLVEAMNDPDFIVAAARRIKELQSQFVSTLSSDPLFGHYEIQPPPNKIDWGTVFSGKIYEVLNAPIIREPNMLLGQAQQKWTTKGTHEFWTKGPGLGDRKVFGGPSAITTMFEEVVIQADGSKNSGKWRVFPLNGEGLWIHRNFIDPVANSRVPVSGWGPPPASDDQSQLIAELQGRITAKNLKADELKAI